MTREIILNFHGLGGIPEAIAADERPYWIDANLFGEIVARTKTRSDVKFTFDDGNCSDLEIAAPILAQHGRTGSFFILTGRLDRKGYLGPEEIQALVGMGMGIGLHGRDHVDWRSVSAETLKEETVGAARVLEDVAKRPIGEVSIPFGAYNRHVISHLKRCGFSKLFTSDGGAAASDAQICNRTSIRSDMSMETIDAVLAGASPLGSRARRRVSTFLRRHLI
jgi:peptidoglycan/xylan/chitin deacetylase (PgdA/CDA1 family)